MILLRHSAVLAVTLLAAACNRYELRRVDCPPDAPSRSAIAWQPARPSGIIRGKVVSVDSLRDLRDATVTLVELGRTTHTSSEGAFQFDVPAGEHTILVRAVGRMPARAWVEVRPDSGVVVLAALEGRPAILDGCGLLTYRARPWWKSW